MAKYPNEIAVSADLLTATNQAQTALAIALSIDSLVVTVTSTALFANDGAIWVDNECVKYTSKDATHFYCDDISGRGFDNTVAATHINASKVYDYCSAAHHNLLKDEIIAIPMCSELGGRLSAEECTERGDAPLG